MKLFQILIISFLMVVNSIGSAFCQDITLSWDPSPTPEVTGYKVYYKQDNMDFPFDGIGATEGASPVDVGDVLSTTLTGLSDGETYYFSVTAYNNADAQSSYSNIVSNSWLPALVIPENGATNEPVPVTFRWETAPSGYDVSYTLFYGTDENEVRNAGSIVTIPPPSNNNLPTGIIIVLAALTLVMMSTRYGSRIKFLPQTASLLLIALSGGFLTACGGGGGGGDGSTSSHSVASSEESVLYSINKGSSDYHQAYDLEASTTYYWKIVATDTQDPNLTYESEVLYFTTGEF